MDIIKIRRGIPGRAKYCACYDDGTPLKAFDRLGDVRKHWSRSIKAGQIQLVRELDKQPNMEAVKENIKMIDAILRSMAK